MTTSTVDYRIVDGLMGGLPVMRAVTTDGTHIAFALEASEGWALFPYHDHTGALPNPPGYVTAPTQGAARLWLDYLAALYVRGL